MRTCSADELGFLHEARGLHDAVEGLIFLGGREGHQARTYGQLIKHLLSLFLGHQKDFMMVEGIEFKG